MFDCLPDFIDEPSAAQINVGFGSRKSVNLQDELVGVDGSETETCDQLKLLLQQQEHGLESMGLKKEKKTC